MLAGAQFGGSYEQQAMLQVERGAVVPHELPGQDPEGGSEVDFAVDSEDASYASTPTAAAAAARAAAGLAADFDGVALGGRRRRSSAAMDQGVTNAGNPVTPPGAGLRRSPRDELGPMDGTPLPGQPVSRGGGRCGMRGVCWVQEGQRKAVVRSGRSVT
jgi:hypothetical protein